MKIAFIGAGNVGAPLADRLQRQGHDVSIAARDAGSKSVAKALERNPQLKVASPAAALAAADVVFLATPFQAAEETLKSVSGHLTHKILVDCTNPVGPGLTHGLNSQRSGTELIQALLPDTKVVKAFTIYGFENFEDNAFPAANVLPAMLYCGNDAAAKQVVGQLIAQLGWEPVDVGGAQQALHLEHMTLLWIRLVRMGGRSPHIVWAALSR
jgi:predicted dinucleotide-binding enzyme